MIEVEKLKKTFRVARHHRGFLGSLRNLVETRSDVVRAVDGISFSIDAGELVGYIGPNGAGKSTTVKMLTGILVPTAGARARRRARAAARPHRAHRADRRGLRPAHAALVGPAGDRVLHAAAPHLPRRRRRASATSSRGSWTLLEPRAAARRARAQALARPAHALRARRGAAARAAAPLPRRADDRPRRGRQGGDPRRSWPPRTASAAPRSCSRRTTSPTSSGCARG